MNQKEEISKSDYEAFGMKEAANSNRHTQFGYLSVPVAVNQLIANNSHRCC